MTSKSLKYEVSPHRPAGAVSPLSSASSAGGSESESGADLAERKSNERLEESSSRTTSSSSAPTLAASQLTFLFHWSLYFLHYRPSAWYWCIVVFYSRLALTIVCAFLVQQPHTQYMVYGYIHLTLLTVYMLYQPYTCDRDNKLALLAHILSISICFLIAAYMPPYNQTIQVVLCFLLLPFTCLCLILIVAYRADNCSLHHLVDASLSLQNAIPSIPLPPVQAVKRFVSTDLLDSYRQPPLSRVSERDDNQHNLVEPPHCIRIGDAIIDDSGSADIPSSARALSPHQRYSTADVVSTGNISTPIKAHKSNSIVPIVDPVTSSLLPSAIGIPVSPHAASHATRIFSYDEVNQADISNENQRDSTSPRISAPTTPSTSTTNPSRVYSKPHLQVHVPSTLYADIAAITPQHGGRGAVEDNEVAPASSPTHGHVSRIADSTSQSVATTNSSPRARVSRSLPQQQQRRATTGSTIPAQYISIGDANVSEFVAPGASSQFPSSSLPMQSVRVPELQRPHSINGNSNILFKKSRTSLLTGHQSAAFPSITREALNPKRYLKSLFSPKHHHAGSHNSVEPIKAEENQAVMEVDRDTNINNIHHGVVTREGGAIDSLHSTPLPGRLYPDNELE